MAGRRLQQIIPPALDEEYLSCAFYPAYSLSLPKKINCEKGDRPVKQNRSEYVAVAEWHYGNRTELVQKQTMKLRRKPSQPVLSARVKLNIIQALSRFAGRPNSGVGPHDAA